MLAASSQRRDCISTAEVTSRARRRLARSVDVLASDVH